MQSARHFDSDHHLHERLKALEAENRELKLQVAALRAERGITLHSDDAELIGRIATSAPYAIFIYDLTQRELMYHNEAAAPLLGDQQQMETHSKRALETRYHPDDHFIWQSFLQRVEQLKADMAVSAEFRVKGDEDEWHWYRFWVRVFRQDDDGQVLQTIWIALDVTEERLAVEHAIHLQMEREKNSLLETFVSDAARELRTPISSINTAVYLIERQPNPDAVPRHIERIVQQAKRLERLLDQLLLLTRLENHPNLHPRACRLQDIIDYVIVSRSTSAEDAQITLAKRASDDVVAYVNEEFLHLAMQEIVDNALRHTPAGGQVMLECGILRAQVVLRISDTGSGMDPETVENAPQRFFKANRQHDGFGLGLTIAERIAELHGGNLQIKSDVERGTVVTLALPVHHLI